MQYGTEQSQLSVTGLHTRRCGVSALHTRIDAWPVIVGCLAVLGFGAAHGVLPEGSGHAVLSYVAGHPHYAGVHLGSILGVLGWTVGVTLLPNMLTHPAASLARFAVASTLVGAAVFVVQFSVDGFAHHALADRWVTAPPDERAALATTVELLEPVMQGAAFAWTAVLWGLPLVLFGWALILDERFPSWLGWPGLILGMASTTGALLRFLQSTLLPDGLVFAAATLGAALWGLALGVTMWRRPRDVPGVSRSGDVTWSV
jgi:hypothetical protein